MEHEKVYTICDNMCLEESLTKEQIENQILDDSGVPEGTYLAWEGTEDSIPAGYEKSEYNPFSGSGSSNSFVNLTLQTSNNHLRCMATQSLNTNDVFNLILPDISSVGDTTVVEISVDGGSNDYHLKDADGTDDLTFESLKNINSYITIAFDGTAFRILAVGIRQKNAITIYANSKITYTSKDSTTLKLNTEATKVGEKFTLTDDGGVKIGKGVSTVAVSGNVYFFTGSNHADGKEAIIYKNSISDIISTGSTRLNYNYIRVLAPYSIVNVAEGDVIYLCSKNDSTNETIIGNGKNNTFLTVVEI